MSMIVPDRLWLPIFVMAALAATVVLSGCDAVFGSKSDETTDDIFEVGRTPPGVFNEVEYVALFPFFERGADGSPFDTPRGVYVGFDEFIYVADARGLHVLDRSGRGAQFLPIPGGATSVAQDRRLEVYVTARRDTFLNGRTWSLPVVLRYSGISTGQPSLTDIIWHPFDEESRRFNFPDPIDTDEEVDFTGVGVLFTNDQERNNAIFVSRRGPVNERASVIRPHNTILEFSPEGVNTAAIVALDPVNPTLRSAINPVDVMTYVHPPQRSGFTTERDFIIAQSPYPDGNAPDGSSGGEGLRYAVLSINAVLTSDGIEYRPDTEKLVIAGDPSRGDGFLYEEFKFENPGGLAFAADETQYIFVTDAAKDSLYVFTNSGIEGVAPPPGSSSTKPVVVSFGGRGDGSMQFNEPRGVGYFGRVVYVADSGNNRISRFKLNTDFE